MAAQAWLEVLSGSGYYPCATLRKGPGVGEMVCGAHTGSRLGLPYDYMPSTSPQDVWPDDKHEVPTENKYNGRCTAYVFFHTCRLRMGLVIVGV